jgi:hypothetical protein
MLLIFALAQAAAPAPALSAPERTAIYRAAGATRIGGGWSLCADDPRKEPAAIEPQGDLNRDGRPEVIVTQSGMFCYGHAEMGFALLSKQADGRWLLIESSSGVPEFLKTKGVGGWPDMSVGGPGFCFPVMRWNGKAYALHRREYQGKRCT